MIKQTPEGQRNPKCNKIHKYFMIQENQYVPFVHLRVSQQKSIVNIFYGDLSILGLHMHYEMKTKSNCSDSQKQKETFGLDLWIA